MSDPIVYRKADGAWRRSEALAHLERCANLAPVATVRRLRILVADADRGLTPEHLREIVKAYRALRGRWYPYLHAAEGGPFVLGRLSNLRVACGVLWADITAPEPVAALLRSGRLCVVGSEVWHDMETAWGDAFPRVLKAVEVAVS